MQAVSDSRLREKYGICREDVTTPYDRQEVCWRNCLEEYPNDDDINYSVIALKTMERYGLAFTPCDMAEAWLLGIPAFHSCTAERAAIRNLMNGLLPPDSAMACNPYREWIGAQIRGDLFSATSARACRRKRRGWHGTMPPSLTPKTAFMARCSLRRC